MKVIINESDWDLIDIRDAVVDEHIDEIWPGNTERYWHREIARILRKRQRHIEYLGNCADEAKHYGDRLEIQLRTSVGQQADLTRERKLYKHLQSDGSESDLIEEFAGELGICTDWYWAAKFLEDRGCHPSLGGFKFQVPFTRLERQNLIDQLREASRFDMELATKLERELLEVAVRTIDTDSK